MTDGGSEEEETCVGDVRGGVAVGGGAVWIIIAILSMLNSAVVTIAVIQ